MRHWSYFPLSPWQKCLKQQLSVYSSDQICLLRGRETKLMQLVVVQLVFSFISDYVAASDSVLFRWVEMSVEKKTTSQKRLHSLLNCLSHIQLQHRRRSGVTKHLTLKNEVVTVLLSTTSTELHSLQNLTIRTKDSTLSAVLEKTKLGSLKKKMIQS